MNKKKLMAITLLTTISSSNLALATDIKVEEEKSNLENTENITLEKVEDLLVEENSELNLDKVKEKAEKITSKGKVVNVSSNLRIREKATTNSSVKGTLKNGEEFTIEGKEGAWFKISTNGIKGYVHSDYVLILTSNSNNNSNGNNNNNNSNNLSGKLGQVINVNSSLRIRANADTSSAILGYLKPNEKVEIISEINGWYKIKKNSTVGYVSANYIKKIDNNSIIPNPTPNPENKPENNDGLTLFNEIKQGKTQNVSSNLRVRNNPSQNATVVAYLLPNDKFTIEGENGSWYYINFQGKKGYAHKDYIKIIKNDDNTESTSEKYKKVLNVMQSQIGSPYVYGGNGETITTSLLQSLKIKYPNTNYNVNDKYINSGYRAFDCSGLMRWSFNEIGIKLGRSTYEQINNGIEVSLNSLKEGDLLFYSDMNHVGMYIGNGQWIESPRTGEFVRVSNIPWSKIGRARRVLN